MTTAEMESMKLERICLVSSLIRELAKLILEQKSAIHADHFSFIIRPHMEKSMLKTFM